MPIEIREIVQLVITVSLPVVPIGVRLFIIRRGNKALGKLRSPIDVSPSAILSIGIGPDSTVTTFPDSADQGCVSRNDPGFCVLNNAIRERGLLSEDVEQFCLAAGNIPEIAGAADLNIPSGPAATINAIFYAVYTTGETELLVYHPSEFHQTSDLIDVRQWVRYEANTRSEWITITLAVSLFLVSI